ncbi:MAG: hypothetical protein AAGD35_10310 [Actinomycetota bacterium]
MTGPLLADSILPVSERTAAGIANEWDLLGRPGAWWTGAERVEIAAAGRAALDGHTHPPGALPPAAAGMAMRVAAGPHTITRAVVDALAHDGVGAEAYVELIGIVSRTSAVDTAVRGFGATPLSLPEPTPGEPTGETVNDAKRRSSFVPMVGGANPATALTAVASSAEAQAALAASLYLAYEEMVDMAIEKEIPRWRMELTATTTSWLNHCVY